MFIRNGKTLINEAFNNLNVDLSYSINKFKNTNYENIILTGSTGFLGIHLLHSIIQNKLKKNYHIFLIIRNNGNENELEKLFKVWTKYIENISFENFKNLLIKFNIKIINGDISKLNWNCKLPKNSILIHSAGIVNTLASKEILKDNYLSISNIYEQIMTKNIHIVHISTLSVFVSSTMNFNNIAKEDFSKITAKYYGGYSQTKFMAEKLVELTHNFTIIRPSLLTGSTFKFKFPDNDYFKMFIQLIYKIKQKPEINFESFFNFIPVDLAADYIIKQIENLGENKKIIHLANPIKSSINDILKHINLDTIKEQQINQNILNSLTMIEKKLFENSLNINKEISKHKKVNKYFNVNLFQGEQQFQTDFNIINNEFYIKKYIENINN